jgi:tetratricopeptide (TPR) repeat protein
VAFFDRLRRLLPGASSADPFVHATRELERGRLDAAETAFTAVLGQAVTAAQVAVARNKLAIVAIRRLDRERAIDQLIAALEADPRSPAAITTVGNLLLEDGDVDEAIVHYEYALLVDDGYAAAYHNLGVALHRKGRRGEAVRMLRKATRLEGRITRK